VRDHIVRRGSPSKSWTASEDACSTDRQAVSAAFPVLESDPSFMVQDAAARPFGSSSLISAALDRGAVTRESENCAIDRRERLNSAEMA
jgi:hypothetical protein